MARAAAGARRSVAAPARASSTAPRVRLDGVQLPQLRGAVLGFMGRLANQAATARALIDAARDAGDVYFEALGAVTLG